MSFVYMIMKYAYNEINIWNSKKNNFTLILICKLKYLTTVCYITFLSWITSNICITPWSCWVVRISTVVMVSMVIDIIIVFILPDHARTSCSCSIYSSFIVYSVIESIDAIDIWRCTIVDVQYRPFCNNTTTTKTRRYVSS